MEWNGRLDFDKFGDVYPQYGPFITDTNFHHVALTKAGGTVVFYLDGVRFYPVPNYSGTFIFTSSIGIGYRPDNGDNSFLGTIDEMGVFNRALSASEIRTNSQIKSMAEFKFFCPQCGQHIQCDTSYAGQQINCPVCQQGIAVPQPPRAATAVSPPVAVQSRALRNVLVAVAAMVVLRRFAWRRRLVWLLKIQVPQIPSGLGRIVVGR